MQGTPTEDSPCLVYCLGRGILLRLPSLTSQRHCRQTIFFKATMRPVTYSQAPGARTTTPLPDICIVPRRVPHLPATVLCPLLGGALSSESTLGPLLLGSATLGSAKSIRSVSHSHSHPHFQKTSALAGSSGLQDTKPTDVGHSAVPLVFLPGCCLSYKMHF